jgi:group I intron endonuclease
MIIYKFTHVASKRVYIGKTSQPLNRRVQRHLRDAENGSPTHFHRALRHYGIAGFKIEQIDFALTLQELNERECFWIRKLRSMTPHGFNLTIGGEGNSEGGRSVPVNKRGGFKGKKHSHETIEKMRAAALIREKRPWLADRNRTEEMREKVSAGKTGKKRPDQSARMTAFHQRNRELKAFSELKSGAMLQ